MAKATQTPMQVAAHWKLDKTVSLPLLGGLIVQTSAVVWLIATMSARVDQFEKRADAFQPTIEKVIRLDTKLDDIEESIADIKLILRTSKVTTK